MLLPSHIWALPPSLIALIVAYASPISSQGTSDSALLPRDVKFFPEHEAIAKRELDIQQRLQRERPIGIRKMSGDPGEKFYLDYWLFADEIANWANESLHVPFTNSFPLHNDNRSSILPRYLDLRRLSLFQKRDYQCPTGTNSCSSISRQDSCCAVGSTCQIIQDTGLGDVGCCAAEEACSGSVSECGGNGYTSCPNSPNGGCCIPGYGCFDVGCVLTSTAVVAPTPEPQASTVTVTSLTTITAAGGGLQTLTTTVIVPAPVPPVTISSSSSSDPPPATTTTITSTTRTTSTRPTSQPCPTDFRSCPASLGGGCCHTDRACGSGRECPALSTSGTFSPPVRATTDTTTTTFSSIASAICPTGFYACSAYHQGGCCQVDRNCDKTSCPTSASTTLVSNSLTIVAPTGSGITAPGSLLTGSCATGWSTCAPADGGGCCPTGYACGTMQCSPTGTADGAGVVGKIAPSGASMSQTMERLLILLAMTISSVALGLGVLL